VLGTVSFTAPAGEQRDQLVALRVGGTVRVTSNVIPNLRSASIAFASDGAFADEHIAPITGSALAGSFTLPPGSVRYRIRIERWDGPAREVRGAVEVSLQREAVIRVE